MRPDPLNPVFESDNNTYPTKHILEPADDTHSPSKREEMRADLKRYIQDLREVRQAIASLIAQRKNLDELTAEVIQFTTAENAELASSIHNKITWLQEVISEELYEWRLDGRFLRNGARSLRRDFAGS
jgi:hypothetical protein